MDRVRKTLLLRLTLGVAVLVLVIGLGWRSGGPLAAAKLDDGTEVIFERYTSGTEHEFGRRDLRKRFPWVPAGFWTLCGYQPGLHAIHKENEPCTILWVRVQWKATRVEPYPPDLHVQAVEADGIAYSWDLRAVYNGRPGEMVLPYRADFLPPGGRLRMRFVEALEQRRGMAGHWPAERAARDALLQEAKHQVSSTFSLPNPNRDKSTPLLPLPLPQTQEHDGLRATLTALRAKAGDNGRFTVEPQVELLWHGGKLTNAFRSWSTITTPNGLRTEPGFRLSAFIDHSPEYSVQASQLPPPPMRGYGAWTWRVNVVSTAEFPELAEERGIPLFTAPIAARWKTNGKRPPEPTVSPEAAAAGLGIADVWPPSFLRLVVRQAPAPWFPAGWKPCDALPFVVVAEADGKRVVLRGSAAGGGYGPYGLASYDFGVNEVAQEIVYGDDWTSKMGAIPVNERPAFPETVEYRLIPRRYWSFEFVVAPVDPPTGQARRN